MPADAASHPFRTRAITAAIVILLAGTAWWLWQPDASPDAAESHWPANPEVRPSGHERGTPSTPEAPTTTARAIPDDNAPPAAGANAATPAPRSADVPSAAASRGGSPDAGNALSDWPATNDDADDDEKDEVPRYWHHCGTVVRGERPYQFTSDSTSAAKGKRSAAISSFPQIPEGAGGGAWCQWVSAEAFRGKRVAYNAFLRTERAVPGARLDVRVDSVGGSVLANTFPRGEFVPGSTPWTRYTIVIDIPENAARIQVSAYLGYSGKMWVDDATLEIVDESWPLTQEVRRPVIGGYAPGGVGARRSPVILNASFEETVPRP